ncbi:hypothetical protein SUGI_0774530 [Cryptomeria japonica]|nr:hypothetical protein SUGI_0774530 [Cryptomeria japonica]
MERMKEHYHSSALLSVPLFVSAYDYSLADLGLIFHSRQWKPPSVPHSVDAYLFLESKKWVVLNVTRERDRLQAETLVLNELLEMESLHKTRYRSKPYLPEPSPYPVETFSSIFRSYVSRGRFSKERFW